MLGRVEVKAGAPTSCTSMPCLYNSMAWSRSIADSATRIQRSRSSSGDRGLLMEGRQLRPLFSGRNDTKASMGVVSSAVIGDKGVKGAPRKRREHVLRDGNEEGA